MTHPLTNKVALITGGTKGIGAATAHLLVSLGARVALSYSSDTLAANDLISKLGPSNALAIRADASSLPDITRLVSETIAHFGTIDILIPNAGILPMKTLAETSSEDFDAAYALNVKGPYFLAKEVVPHMSPGGRIIFISTTLNAASTVTPNYLLYCSTKGAVEQITRLLAKDLASKGINVNAVAPGPTGTELFLRGKPEELVKRIGGMSPYNRLGEPEEIADVIAFLAGNESRWVSGQILRVNGAAV